MSTVRRRVLRPHRAATIIDPRRQRLIEKRRAQLDRERSMLTRWMSRLRRAFHAVEKQQRRIAGIGGVNQKQVMGLRADITQAKHGVRRELPMGELKNYTAFKDRMLKRRAAQRVVESEKVKV